MIRIWLHTKFLQITDKAYDAFCRYMDGVMEEIHKLDMKDPNHQLWHPDCPDHICEEDREGALPSAWYPEVSVIDNEEPTGAFLPKGHHA